MMMMISDYDDFDADYVDIYDIFYILCQLISL